MTGRTDGPRKISIHAPRGGSDLKTSARRRSALHFNPRSPWGERRRPWKRPCGAWRFQSTLPVGGATLCSSVRAFPGFISIHAPRGGSDAKKVGKYTVYKDFNPRSPWGERPQPFSCTNRSYRFQSTLPVGGATAKMHRFSFASSAKRVIFVIFSKLGAVRRESAEKGGGDLLSRSVRTSRGKYGCLAFAFRESWGLRENRRFYSQSVLFSFRIDCQGSRIAGCPFRGP